MQLHELKDELGKGNIKPFYMFTGEEESVMNIYIQKIAAIAKTMIKRVEAISEIYSKLQNNTMFETPVCYVIRNDKDYIKQEDIWYDLINGIAQGQNIIILIYDNLDKRGKCYKQHSDLLVCFEKLDAKLLAKYANREIGLSIEKGIKLANWCGCSYGRLLLECNKIKHLAEARKCGVEKAFSICDEERVIYKEVEGEIFGFINAVCRRDAKSAYRLFNHLQDENPLAIISLLYTNIRNVLLVQSTSSGNISTKTGLTAWQVNNAKNYCNYYSISELTRFLRIIRETEKGIKTGTIEQDAAVDYILVNVL